MNVILKKTFAKNICWDFSGENTKDFTHCYHDYPARMIPQIPRRLLSIYGKNASLLLDSYCGTGTSLVEALVFGINAIGTDLNPLACLIAKTKTTPLNLQVLDLYLKEFFNYSFEFRFGKKNFVIHLPTFNNLEFWFSPQLIKELAILKHFIDEIKDVNVQNFFKVAFSETVRECSYTRNNEFKLFKMNKQLLAKFNPQAFSIMEKKLERNRKGLIEFLEIYKNFSNKPTCDIYNFNICGDISQKYIPDNIIDIVITSPPYGDSRTTVAYGQFSRLSSQWLGFAGANLVDKNLMGGIVAKEIPKFDCESLDIAIKKIYFLDIKRAKEVASFYIDLQSSINNVAKKIKKKGYACYVVGNRKVKGVVLPTNEAIVSFFKQNGFNHIKTIIRNIPNKRMPSKNSPTNIIGKLDSTITQEYIVVMQKIFLL